MIDPGADWRTRWIARLGAGLVWILARTWRVRYVNRSELDEARRQRRAVIFVIWHGQLLPALWTHRRQNISVLISEHRDGEIIARVAHFLGFRTVRGSTTRGANRALIGLVRELEAGYDVAITPDGPKGPRQTFAPGALLVSQRADRPILPVGIHASRAWRLKSWDRFVLPKPFARITVFYEPFMAAPGVNPKALSDEAPRYQAAVDAAVAGAEREGGGPPERRA
ncbi:MAG TPA: lysophospholipid acyltransferase family protein [Gemmatimonadaceae bacterium]